MNLCLYINAQKWFLTIASSVSMLCVNIIIGNASLLESLGNIFGISSLSHMIFKMCFIVFAFLVQNNNSNIISFHIENFDYMLVRYNSKSKIFFLYSKRIIINNFFFITFCFLGLLLASLFFDSKVLSDFNLFIFLGTILQGFCKCCIIAFLQATLSLRFSEEKVVGILVVLCTLYSFVIPSLLSFVPNHISNNTVFGLIRTFFCLFLMALAFLMFKRKFMKEWQKYAN